MPSPGATFLFVFVLALSFYGIGLIWAMELDVFRSWQLLRDADELQRIRAPHWRRLPYYVFIPIGWLFIATIGLVWFRPSWVPVELVWTALLLQLASHLLTAIFWGPWQARIARAHEGPDGPSLRRIVHTHWVRTALVTSNGLVLLAATAAAPAWSSSRDHDAHPGVADSQAQGSIEAMSMSERQKGHAAGRTVVKTYEPTVFDEVPDGPSLTDIRVTETFSGDLEGEGIARGVQAARADGTSIFVGTERFRGGLHGKRGTFLLQVRRAVVGREASGEWSVVPGSGTGELRGLRGDGGFKAELGQHGTIWLDYYFETT